jgi:hypothetical protein
MEFISIQVPASLYTSIFVRYGEETTSTITTLLTQLVGEEVITPEPRASGGKTPYPRPSEGTITGQVWEIADKIQEQTGRAEREDVIKACMSKGININTASTQFSYWRKANP